VRSSSKKATSKEEQHLAQEGGEIPAEKCQNIGKIIIPITLGRGSVREVWTKAQMGEGGL